MMGRLTTIAARGKSDGPPITEPGPMTIRLISASLLLAAFAPLVQAATELQGFAYDRRSGELLYTEQHRMAFTEQTLQSHRVRYLDPDGEVFVEKTLDYSRHPYAPDFDLHDLRDGYREGGAVTDEGYRLYRQDREGAPQRDARVRLGPELVVDAGFDRYVKAHLPELLEQERGQFRMAVPGHLTSLRFRIRLLDREPLFGLPAVSFRVEPASLLRLFTDHIDITYDSSTGRLLRYVGISNIRDSQGDRHDVRIDFPPEGQHNPPAERQ